MENFLKNIGLVFFTVMFELPMAFFNGWVMTKLWSWFIVSPFSVPALGVVQACGIYLAFSFLFRSRNTSLMEKQLEETESYSEKVGFLFKNAFGSLIVYPSLALAFGFFFHCFM